MCFTDVFNFDSSTGVFKFLCSTDVFKTAKMHDYLQGKECDNPARSAKFVYFGPKGVLHMCSSAQINRKPEYRSLFANIMLSL